MKHLQNTAGFLAAFLLILTILITSFQVVAYGDFSFFEKEYVKYQVTEDLNMELEDVMDVTYQMMDYLIGEKEELSVITMVDGREQDFFNEQDRLHMWDVQNLFIGGLKVRAVSIVAVCICLAFLFGTKADWKKILTASWFAALAVYGGLLVVFGTWAAIDFTAFFTFFHEVFFTNDLWLFDPATDYMIRMLPEGFFADIALRIVSLFVVLIMLISGICLLYRRKVSVDKMRL